MTEGIVLLEQHQHGEIALVAEDAGNGEARIRRAPQGRGGAIGVKALEVHGAVRLQLVYLVHCADLGRQGARPGDSRP